MGTGRRSPFGGSHISPVRFASQSSGCIRFRVPPGSTTRFLPGAVEQPAAEPCLQRLPRPIAQRVPQLRIPRAAQQPQRCASPLPPARSGIPSPSVPPAASRSVAGRHKAPWRHATGLRRAGSRPRAPSRIRKPAADPAGSIRYPTRRLARSGALHPSTPPAARLRADSRTTEPKTYPVGAPVRHCPARQRRSLPVRRYRRRQRSLVSICEKSIQRAWPLRHRCGRLPRSAGAYERTAPFEFVEPFLDRLGASRDRANFGHRLAATGYGDGLPFAHMADDLGESRPRVVHGILEIHADKPYQSHKSGQARDGGGWIERPGGLGRATWLAATVAGPLMSFFRRNSITIAAAVLGFIFARAVKRASARRSADHAEIRLSPLASQGLGIERRRVGITHCEAGQRVR